MKKALLTLVGSSLALTGAANAQNVTWSAAVNTTWDTTTANWTGDSTTFANTNNATFGNTGVGAITIAAGTLSPNDVTFTHTSGNYTFATGGGNVTATGNLALTGGGLVQFGNMGNSGDWQNLFRWAGSTTISGGSRLNITQPGSTGGTFNYIGGNASTITLNNGTLALGASGSAYRTLNNSLAIGAGGGTIIGQNSTNVSIFDFSGNVTGSGALTLQNTGASSFTGRPSVNFSGNNSAYNGAVSIIGNAPNPGDVGPAFVTFVNASSLFSRASAVAVTNGGMARFQFGVTDANLSNFTFNSRSGIAVEGANGTLTSVTSPMNYVAEGGYLVLDNRDAINNDRISDSSALTLNSNRFMLVGRNTNTQTVSEDAGAITYAGGSRIILNRSNNTSNFVNLSIDSLTRSGTGTIVIETLGTGSALNSTANVTITGTAPTVDNGMITPSVVLGTGHHFVTQSGGVLQSAAAGYTTVTANTTYTPVSTNILNVTVGVANGQVSLTGNGTVHAVRVENNNGTGSNNGLNLAGNTLTVGSGGVILYRSVGASAVLSNGTLAFGSNEGLIYSGGGANTLSAAITGSAGITKFGDQSLTINNGLNAFTGGVNINEGQLQAGGNVNALNAQNLRISQFGQLVVAVSGLNMGGVTGSGILTTASSGGNRTINIGPTSGSHTFDGNLQQFNATNTLTVNKTNSGTQIFGTSSRGTYTGATNVQAGTLLINGNFSAANGTVTVATGATLGGSGTIGGATTIQAGGTLAPGNSPGVLTFTSGLMLAGNVTMDINGLTRGTQYDGINLTGGSLGYGGTMDLTFGSAFLGGGTTFDLFNFSGSQSGTFTSVASAATYIFTLNSGNGYSANDQFNNTWSFNHATGDLSFTAVPEPTTWALLAGSLTALMIFRRRRS